MNNFSDEQVNTSRRRIADEEIIDDEGASEVIVEEGYEAYTQLAINVEKEIDKKIKELSHSENPANKEKLKMFQALNTELIHSEQRFMALMLSEAIFAFIFSLKAGVDLAQGSREIFNAFDTFPLVIAMVLFGVLAKDIVELKIRVTRQIANKLDDIEDSQNRDNSEQGVDQSFAEVADKQREANSL